MTATHRDDRSIAHSNAEQRDAALLTARRAVYRTRQRIRGVAERLYTRHLLTKVTQGAMPAHIALVLDGNRRFARTAGLQSVADGHRLGASKVNEVIGWCDQLGIPQITLWALSTDNLRRPQAELDQLYRVISDELDELAAPSETPRRLRVIGRLGLLPEELREKARELEAQTAQNGSWSLNIAVAYGGRDELIDAFRRYLIETAAEGASPAEVAEQLSAEELGKRLYIPHEPEPDLIIRTSGEARLSGFLLWQSVYSEIYFCDTLWPAFRKLDFLRAIRSFQGRNRRYGT